MIFLQLSTKLCTLKRTEEWEAGGGEKENLPTDLLRTNKLIHVGYTPHGVLMDCGVCVLRVCGDEYLSFLRHAQSAAN